MPYIPPEVVEKAREMDLLTYLKNYESHELVHFGGSTYCTREHDSLKISKPKETSISDYVIADSEGQPLSYSQFKRVWQYVVVRSTKERTYYKYVNGQSIRYTVKPTLGSHQKNNPKIVYSMDFEVTPHQLRHTYITNLLYSGVDPKTVQYLAGHENSKTTMDIYAKIKYNKPDELLGVVNAAFHQACTD